MPLTRLTATLAAATLGGVLVATTYGAQAAKAPAPTRPAHVRLAGHDRFVAPAPHHYRPGSSLRMGLHCDSTDMSM